MRRVNRGGKVATLLPCRPRSLSQPCAVTSGNREICSRHVIRDGLDALDIDTLAAKVHCSRATAYRHAGGKAAIRDAVLTRLAAAVIDKVWRAVDGLSGSERVIAAITVALRQIRCDPLRRLMFSAGKADLTGLTDDDPQSAQWIVRVAVSLAYSPIGNSSDEREVLERFVAPAFDMTASAVGTSGSAG